MAAVRATRMLFQSDAWISCAPLNRLPRQSLFTDAACGRFRTPVALGRARPAWFPPHNSIYSQPQQNDCFRAVISRHCFSAHNRQHPGGQQQPVPPPLPSRLTPSGVHLPSGAIGDASPHRYWTVPNAMTAARMVLAPIVGYYIFMDQPVVAAGLFATAAALDYFDGVIARRFNQGSLLGTFLDPLADKALLACTAVALGLQGVLHPALVLLVVGRDAGLILGSFYYRAVTKKPGEPFFSLSSVEFKIEPTTLSKVNTVLQMGCIMTGVLHSAFAVPDRALLDVIQVATGITTVWSGVDYWNAAGFGKRSASATAAAAAAAAARSGSLPTSTSDAADTARTGQRTDVDANAAGDRHDGDTRPGSAATTPPSRR